VSVAGGGEHTLTHVVVVAGPEPGGQSAGQRDCGEAGRRMVGTSG